MTSRVRRTQSIQTQPSWMVIIRFIKMGTHKVQQSDNFNIRPQNDGLSVLKVRFYQISDIAHRAMLRSALT